MSDDFLNDFALPAATGFAAHQLSQSLLSGTRLGARKTGDAIVDAISHSGAQGIAITSGLTVAIASYAFLHPKREEKPHPNVGDSDHQGTVEVSRQQQGK